MISIPESTLYEMIMFDTSDYAYPARRPSLDKIATDTYGKKYVGQQTGDMLSNDSWHVYDMSTEDKCLEWIPFLEEEEFYSYNGKEHYCSVPAWLKRDRSKDKYDFEDERAAPVPQVMLATLILDGHLPYGRYLVEVSW